MRAALAIATLASLLAALPAAAQTPYVPIEQRLTAEQRRATGLDRLSASELALLNDLLRDERTAARKEEAKANVGLRPTRPLSEAREEERVESRVKGEFRGWSPGTVLELENGQAWRVTGGTLDARRTVSPRITIAPGMLGAWYLKVEGEVPQAKVRRIR